MDNNKQSNKPQNHDDEQIIEQDSLSDQDHQKNEGPKDDEQYHFSEFKNKKMPDFNEFGGGMGMKGGFGYGPGLSAGFGGIGGFGGLGGFNGVEGMNSLGANHGSRHTHNYDSHKSENLFNDYGLKLGQDQKKTENEAKKKQNTKKVESQQQQLARLTKKLDIPEQDQVTLVDWAIRGPAEVLRLVLEYILVPYKQKKYTYSTRNKWLKEDKPQLQSIHPLVELPYLQDGDKIICGIEAIIIYILYKYNRQQLLGRTIDEKIKLATAVAIYTDLHKDYMNLCFGLYEQQMSWQRVKDKYMSQKFRYHFGKLCSLIKYRSFLVCQIYTWVDFAVAEMYEILSHLQFRFKDYNLQLQNYVSKIQAIPQFIVYKKSYRFHERPYNSFGAAF